MPLSRGERRTLDHIERALARDDPQFAQIFGTGRPLRRRTAVVVACCTAAILLLAGRLLAGEMPIVGIVISCYGVLALAVRWPSSCATASTRAPVELPADRLAATGVRPVVLPSAARPGGQRGRGLNS